MKLRFIEPTPLASTPGKFTEVEMPSASIRDPDCFGLLMINDFINVNAVWQNVDQQISRYNRDQSGPNVRTPHELELRAIDGINVTGYPRHSRFIPIHGPYKMTMQVFFENSPVNHVNFFPWLQNHKGLFLRIKSGCTIN